MVRTVATGLLGFALIACSSTVTLDESPPPAAPTAPAIAKVVTRDRTITLLAGKGTVRATVVDASGHVVADQVPIDELQRIDATAYDVTHTSFAGTPVTPGTDVRLLGQ